MKVVSTATVLGQAFKNAGRAREIFSVFARHGFREVFQRMGLERWVPLKRSEAFDEKIPVPERLRQCFEELGPTFVKLGQILATRPDLIPEPFIDELEKLQDKVGTVPFRDIEAAIESEFKKPLSALFQKFEETPLAAASIAQVHGAVLKTGERVAVKIQRPGIAPLIQNDIAILRGIAALLVRYIPESLPMNPVGLVEEFVRTILYETDFLVEANNIRRIQKNLSGFPRVRIPRVFTALSTARVLTLERIEGLRFSDRHAIVEAGLKPSELVSTGADVFFHMVMVDGFFHADLHPGNLFALPDGSIGIIDFGIVGRLSRRVQDTVLSMFVALMDEDFETFAVEYLDLCQSTGQTNVALLQKDLMDVISPYMGMSLGQVNVGKLLLRSTSIAARHRLQVPRELLLLFRALVNIEALGKRLEPEFDMLSVGNRQAQQIISQRYSRDRVLKDLFVVGRDLQIVLERAPRLGKRFLRQWAENGFAFETKSRETAELAQSVRAFTYYFLAGVAVLSFTALGLVTLFLNRGPYLFEVPVSSLFSLTSALGILCHGLWGLRNK